MKILKSEAKKILNEKFGEGNFLGTLEQCFEHAKKRGFEGLAPIFRLDSNSKHGKENSIFSAPFPSYLNYKNKAWYYMPDVLAEYEHLPNEDFIISGKEMQTFIEINTRLKTFRPKTKQNKHL